ncbi:protein-methionine-sulfoxide reductase heme-binding subunit MsrQ [Acidisoma sp. C75]
MTEAGTAQPRPIRRGARAGAANAAAPGSGRGAARARLPWFTPPWRDRAGRLSPFKTVLLLLCLLPGLLMAIRWSAGTYSATPLNRAMLMTGVWAIWFLLASLAVSPARAIFGLPKLIQVRRMLGLTAAAYTLAHLVLYVMEQGWNLGFVLNQIFTILYLLIGFIAVLGLILLSATSTDAAIRRLGRRWKWLHRLVYPIAVLSLWHFFLTQKIDVTLAVLPTGLFLWLMLWRGLPAGVERQLAGLLLLALAAGAATIAVEYAWYALETFVPPGRVLAANWQIGPRGPRPSFWVTFDGLILLAAAFAWRHLPQHEKLGGWLTR